MILSGLADFSRPLIFERGRGYYRYRHDGAVVLPHNVELPFEEPGLPKIGLQLIRSSTPFGGGKGQAILNVVLKPNFDLESAREYFDQKHIATAVQPCVITQGQVCFSSPQHFSNSEVVDELKSCRALNLYGGSAQKVVMRLSSLAGTLWKNLISDGVLLINANMTYRISGVSPRFGYMVRFNPKHLLASIQFAAEQQGLYVGDAISVASLQKIFNDNIESLPVTLHNVGQQTAATDIPELLDQTTRKLFIASIVDRIIERFSVASLISNNELLTTLSMAKGFNEGTFEWNLSEALVTQRLWSITANPFESINNRLTEAQLSELIEERELPFIGSNKSQLLVYANFVDRAKNVAFVGVNIYQSASPPERPVPLNKSLDLSADDNNQKIFLHSNRDNTICYGYQGIVEVETEEGIIKCEGQRTSSSEKLLVVGPQDFSIMAIPFSLDPSWQDRFTADINLQFKHSGRWQTITKTLNSNNPSFQFIVPADVAEVNGTVTLKDIASEMTLNAEFSGSSGMAINHFAFLQCGKQTVNVVAEFSETRTLQAVELRPFKRPSESFAEISLVHLTPSKPEMLWHWFSHSPFDAAYQYRVLDNLGNPMHEWRTVEYPYPILNLGEEINHNIEPTVVTGSI